MVKNLPAMRETWVQSLGWEDLWEKERQPIPVFLPGEFHGKRSLAGCSPWGLKESGMTEQLTLSVSFTFIREAIPYTLSKTTLFKFLSRSQLL